VVESRLQVKVSSCINAQMHSRVARFRGLNTQRARAETARSPRCLRCPPCTLCSDCTTQLLRSDHAFSDGLDYLKLQDKLTD
jgi:hypothetical protein